MTLLHVISIFKGWGKTTLTFLYLLSVLLPPQCPEITLTPTRQPLKDMWRT